MDAIGLAGARPQDPSTAPPASPAAPMRRRFMRPIAQRHPAATLWWLRPAPLLLLIVVPVYLSYLGFTFENVVPKRYIPGWNYVWGLVLIAVLALGAMITSFGAGRTPAVDPRRATPLRVEVPSWYLGLLLAAALFAYAIWFGPLLSNPAAVVELFSGERGNLRDTIDTEPGLTTLTQCGVAYIVLYVIKRHAGITPPAPWERAALLLIFVLTAMRAVLWSERLAVVEAGAAYVVASAAFVRFRHADARRLAAALPFIGPVVLYLAFTATEYFRSWAFYKDFYDSVWVFSYERLTAYYAVAANSGIGLLQETADWPRYTGRYVLEWLYRLPGLGESLVQMLSLDPRTQYRAFLEQHARIEFNNPTGLFITVFDIGYFGSAIYFFIAGAIVGLAWKAWYRHRLLGLMFYPFCFLFLLELLRFNYFAASRFVPIAGSLLLALLFMGAQRRRRRHVPLVERGHRGGNSRHGSAIERFV